MVRALLKDYLGVANDDIRVVVNDRATKANIMHRLRAMIAESEPGDVAVFYFSGHGSQVRDRDGDELVDGVDEVLCPYDLDWDRRTYILDDDLDRAFAELPEGALLEAFFDCCFWGAGFRATVSPDEDQFAVRSDVRFVAPPFDVLARAEGEEHRLHRHRLSACDCFTDRNVLWAASREGQPAAEETVDGRANGIFTYWGCQFIAENIDRMGHYAYSRAELLEDIRTYLHSLGYAQMPELSAPEELLTATPLQPAIGPGSWVERY